MLELPVLVIVTVFVLVVPSSTFPKLRLVGFAESDRVGDLTAALAVLPPPRIKNQIRTIGMNLLVHFIHILQEMNALHFRQDGVCLVQ
jgi:hypothetical protein